MNRLNKIRVCCFQSLGPFSHHLLYAILQTASAATWTETIKNTATSLAVVNSSIALSNFKTWMNSAGGGGDLPAHDHAMLFTREVCIRSNCS